MQVQKRDGTLVSWDTDKIIAAMKAAGSQQSALLGQMIQGQLRRLEVQDPMPIEIIQDAVEEVLMRHDPEVAKAFILYREEHKKLRSLSPDPNAIADYIHPAKYGRYQPRLKRRETYKETVNRVQHMYLNKFPKQRADILAAFACVQRKEVLPSMRSMQFAGKPLLQHNARMYNCSFTLLDRTTAFSEAFYLLLCGCGVGYSVQYRHINSLSKIKKMSKVRHFEVEDTIEGWADALFNLIDSAMTGVYAEFDYSAIRLKGSALNSGGLAPGHVPLKTTLEMIRVILIMREDNYLRSIDCHDIMCLIAESVLSGGVRRSSLIALFDDNDERMLTSKFPDKLKTASWRALANNSAVFHREHSTYEDFHRVMEYNLSCHGEPGFFFTTDWNYGCNPCGEIGLDPTYKKQTGFAFCNLTEVNGATVHDRKDFLNRIRIAAMIGTWQATFTDFKYLSPISKLIAERDALLGISITGIMDNPDYCLNPELLQEGALHAKNTNTKVAKLCGINIAKRLTTVKPSGTASLELGCVGSGIHSHHAKRYFRRITANHSEPVALYFQQHNPHMVEEKPNGDLCLTFPVETKGLTLETIDTKQFLRDVFTMYENWVKPGTREIDSKQLLASIPSAAWRFLTHNVSSTVVFSGEKEFWYLVNEIWKFRDSIASMTFLPYFSDKLVPFMPRERVQTTADELRWRELIEKYTPVDYTKMVEHNDVTIFEPECQGQFCGVK